MQSLGGSWTALFTVIDQAAVTMGWKVRSSPSRRSRPTRRSFIFAGTFRRILIIGIGGQDDVLFPLCSHRSVGRASFPRSSSM